MDCPRVFPAGQASGSELFYPWGQPWFNAAPEWHYAGFEYGDMAGLPTPNREYSTLPSRWMSPDPAGLSAVDPTNPQSLNRYAYAMNNPTTLIDPLGLQPPDYRGWGNSECGMFSHVACNGHSVTSMLDEFALMNIPVVMATYIWQPPVDAGWSTELENAIYVTVFGASQGNWSEIDTDLGDAFSYFGGQFNGQFNSSPYYFTPEENQFAPHKTPQQDQQACHTSFLMNNGGPGAQALVNNFSLYSYVPTSGGISAALRTPAAQTSIETLIVKGGILAAGYGLGKLLNLPLLQSAASGAAEFVGAAASLGTGIATTIDARARYVCGN